MPEDDQMEKKNEDKVVLQVYMHCEGCKQKVWKSIKGFPGVETVEIDMKGQKVTVKGKIDAKKFSERVNKKSGKATKILYPEQKKDDGKKDEKKGDKKDEKKEPADVTVVLKVQVHCEACSKKVQKITSKIKGVYDVKMEGDKLTIKGKDLNPPAVCGEVMKKSGKHAEIVPPKKDEKKEEAKKDENKEEAKKDEKKTSAALTEYVYAPQCFSDENPNACTLM